MADRLKGHPSPYLEQHADNPVDWWPWCDGAFAEAKRRDVPVFLSIGYATCHWCHVMAHESFEDEAVAAHLNEHFVAIKVDREERPDVDAVYMAACQRATGRGGWPLSAFLDHDRRPFFVGTYFPPQARGNHPGFQDVLAHLSGLWSQERDKVLHAAEHLSQALQPPEPPGGARLDHDVVQAAVQGLRARFDTTHGGFGAAPKFPSPHILRFLLEHEEGRNMAMATLHAMTAGGIHDHVGGGFHRYSTDAAWLLPHFEKMLYDQAMHLMAYSEAASRSEEPAFARTAGRIIEYLERDLRHPEGGFFAAEDADSEGEEGTFYVWRFEELEGILTPEARAAWGMKPDGNFHDEATGQPSPANILHFPQPPAKKALDEIEAARARILHTRSKRERPLRDEKILTDWNGLAIAALAIAARHLPDPMAGRALRLAEDAGRFVLQHLADGAGLRHRYRDGVVDDRAFLADHAYFAWGLLELHQTTLNGKWLQQALRVASWMDDAFSRPDGGLFDHPEDPQLPTRTSDSYDGATPSPSSVAFQVWWRLGRITGDVAREQRAWRLADAVAGEVREHPVAYVSWLHGIAATAQAAELLIRGDDHDLLGVARQAAQPGRVVLRDDEATRTVAPWIDDAPSGAYLCVDHACRRPVHDVDALRRLLAAD